MKYEFGEHLGHVEALSSLLAGHESAAVLVLDIGAIFLHLLRRAIA